MATESERCVDELLVQANNIDDLSKRLEAKVTDELIGESRELLTEIRSYMDNNRAIIPSYIMKKISESLNRLEKQINNSSRSKLKFKFKTKSSDTTPSSPTVNPPCPRTKDCEAVKTQHEVASSLGFQNRNNEHLSLAGADVESKDVALVGLNNCTVSIFGLANTVYIRDLTNTSVTICLACRAITVKNCSNCKLTLICQQLRIDSTNNCEFTIFTSARSMLEASTDLKFKELKLEHLCREDLTEEQVQNLLRMADFNVEQNNWRCIDDFDWLSEEVASKNYKLMSDAGE